MIVVVQFVIKVCIENNDNENNENNVDNGDNNDNDDNNSDTNVNMLFVFQLFRMLYALLLSRHCKHLFVVVYKLLSGVI